MKSTLEVDAAPVAAQAGHDPKAGAALIRSIRERVPLLPIVVLSGYPDVGPAYQAGANAFVRKSANLDEFFEKVREVMHFWIDVAELTT